MARKKKEEQQSCQDNNQYDRKELLSVLQKVSPAISSKDNIEEMQYFIFTGKNLITNNGQISICHPLKTNFKCMTSSNELSNILFFMNDEKIIINHKDNKLYFKEENDKESINAELVTKDISEIANEFIEVIELNNFDESVFKKLPDDFIDAIKICSFTVSKDNSGSILTCISINNNVVISSDDYRISMFTLKESINDKFLIPLKSVNELVNLDIKGYFKKNNWLYFLVDNNIIFCSRMLSDEFPEVMNEFKFKAKNIILPDEFSNIVKRASIFAEGEDDIDKKIEVKIKDGKISCKGQNELGWIESKTGINIKEEFTFSINPNFLLQILSKTKNMKLGEGRIMFESENFKHLIALYND